MKPTKAMADAFREGFTNPNAPLTAGEMRLIRESARVGPQVVFSEDVAELPATVHIGEISHQPCADEGDIIDAEIVE